MTEGNIKYGSLPRVIADDLTGASEAGAAFIGAGPAEVLLYFDPARWSESNAATVVLDIDTRDGPVRCVRNRLSEAAANVSPGQLVLVKVDSTLRGHLRPELETLAEVFFDRRIILAPAFPRQGRTTRQGVQHVRGVPLHRSDAWAAEASEPPHSLRELGGCLATLELEMDIVRSGVDRLALALDAASRHRLVVVDAETDDDLDALVVAAGRTGADFVWVGSGGLAAALARRAVVGSVWATDGGGSGAPARPERLGLTERPSWFVAVVGSASPIARRQAEVLASGMGVELLAMPAAGLATAGEASPLSVMRRSVVVSVADDGTLTNPHAVVAGLAARTAALVAGAPLAVLVGGATARAVLMGAGVGHLKLAGEFACGTVISRPSAGPEMVATKAGTFGDEDALLLPVRDLCLGQRGI